MPTTRETIGNETLVSAIVRSYPASVRVFQEYGIDFCCGGSKPLSEACREKDVSIDRLLADVEKARRPPEGAGTRDWNAGPLSELIDHILDTHHAYLRTELPRLARMLAQVIEKHGEKHSESLPALDETYTGLKKELTDHMWKEENVLFPLVKELERTQSSGSGAGPQRMPVSAPIMVMEQEHEAAAAAMREMRRLTGDYTPPEDACNTYRALLDGLQRFEADTHQHIHLENNILFPKAIELQESLSGP